MARIRVWAPAAKEVGIELDGARRTMNAAGGGWWESEPPPLRHGSEYALVLDDRKPVADPRSPWQPHGPEGPSRHLDHALFPWTDNGWQPPPLSSALIYEVHTGTFSPEGTFEGVAKRLPYLRDLGVTHLELMPVNGFPGTRGWGYDGVNLYAPQEAYGGPGKLKELVDACHRAGMAAILDVVYNHLGPAGNYLHWFGPYYSERYHTPWGGALNFDGEGSDEVRRFFCDNALMWLRDYHFDGLRLDAVHAIYDRSALHILEQLAQEVHELQGEVGRHLFLIAESDLNDPRIVQRPEIGGCGIDAQWSDDFHHALHAVLTGEEGGYYQGFGSLAALGKALRQAFVFDGTYSEHRKRSHGRTIRMLSGESFVVFFQNHDQVGNRAKGERSSHLLGPGRLKVAAALVLTSPFIPMLFQGEEWSASTPFQYFTDHQDPELGKAVSEGRRKEFAAFGWDPDEIPDPQAPETFGRSRLNWEEKEWDPHRSTLEWHRKLIGLRRALPSLSDGRLDRVEVLFSEEEKWFVVHRGPVSIVCNLAPFPQEVPTRRDGPLSVLLSSEEGCRVSDRGILLPPDSVVILSQASLNQGWKACKSSPR